MISLLLLLAIRVNYALIFGKNGWKTYCKSRQAVAQLVVKNRQLVQRNQQLLIEVEALVDDLEAIEEHARYDLGMVRSEEQFYRLLPAKQQP